MKYKVFIEETVRTAYIVEAPNEEEAVAIAMEGEGEVVENEIEAFDPTPAGVETVDPQIPIPSDAEVPADGITSHAE